MDITNGYIKLYRSLLEGGWYDDINTKVVFLHLLLTANFKDGEWHGIQVKRGDVITSISSLSKQLGLSESKVRTALNHLKSTGEITGSSHGKFRIISIKNYNAYQGDDKVITGSSQDDDRVITGSSQQLNNDKNDNKERMKENSVFNSGYEQIFEKFVNDFNLICVSYQKIETLQDNEKIMILQILNQKPNYDFTELLKKVEASDYLSGRSGRWSFGKQATLSWILRQDNIKKILSGNYDNKERVDNGGRTKTGTNAEPERGSEWGRIKEALDAQSW